VAETYRGLTIRIGGDTTALTKALKYSNGAISQTQIELNKLAQALKLDPSNVQTYNMHLNYMGQQASNTATKLAQLRDAQESVRNEPLKIVVDGSIKDASTTFDEFVQKYRDGSANIAADTQSTKRVLDTYTQQLAEMYNKLTNYVQNAAGVESAELVSALELAMTPAEKLEQTLEGVWDRFFDMPDGIERSEESIDKLATKAEDLSKSFGKFFDQENFTIDTEEFEKALHTFVSSTGNVFKLTEEQTSSMSSKVSARAEEIAAALKSVDPSEYANAVDAARENITKYIADVLDETGLMVTQFNNANRNVSLNHIEKVLESLRDETGMTEEQIGNILGELGNLQAGFKSADTEYKNFLKAESLMDLEVEIQKTEAQINSMARAMADLKVPDNISRTLMYIQENVNALSTSFQQLIATAGGMSDIIAKSGSVEVNVDFGDPTSNVNAFEVALSSLVQSEQNVQEGMAAIRRELDEFAGKGVFIEDITDTTKSATQQLYDAKDALVDAEANLAELNGTIKHYEDLIAAFQAIGDVGLQTFIVNHEGEELDKTQQAVVNYLAALENVEDRKKAISKATDDYRKKLEALAGAVDATTGKYENLSAAEHAVKDSQEELENAKMRVALEGLQTDLVKTQNQTLKVEEAIHKLADSMTEQMTEGFADNLFGSSERQIEVMKTAFDATIERAKVLDATTKELPKNQELAKKRTQAVADAIKAGGAYADELRTKMDNILPDGETDEVAALREEFGSAKNAVIQLTEQADILNERLVRLRTQRDLSPEGGKRWTELNDSIDVTNVELETVKTQLHGIEGVTKGAIAIEQWEEWSDKVDEVNGKIETLNHGSIPGATGSDNSAAFEQVFDRVLQYAERVGSAVVESANTIDTAYRDMRKTVQGTEEQFESLKQAAISFSQVHAVSSDTLLEMEALGGQLGVSTDALNEFGEVASNLDIATDIDAETIALQLGQISNVMSDLDETTFDNFGDAIVRLGNNMAAQESSIMNVAQRMSSVANVASMSTPDLLALSAAIASTGQRSESAATAISNTMTGIASAVAAGGKNLKAFAEIADMSADGFASAWMTDPMTALKAFVNGLESLSDTNVGAIAALEEMGISSIRQETALLGLASTVDVLDDALKMSNDAFNGVSDQWGQAGDAAIEAQRKSEGFSGSMQIMQNNLSNLAETMGDALILPIQVASVALKGLTDLFNFIPDPIKGTAAAIVGFTAVGGVALDMLDKMSKGMENLSSVPAGTLIETVTQKLTKLAPQLENNATLAAALGTGLTMGGVVLATAALSALISTLADAYNEMRELNEAEENLETANKNLADAVDGVTAKSDDMTEGLKAIKVTANDTKDALNDLADIVDEVAGKINERQIDMDVDFHKVDEAVETIERYADSTRLTYGQQADLVNAVDALNEAMGTSFEVVDQTKGIIKDLGDDSIVTAGQIREWSDSYKNIEQGNKIVQDMDDTYEAIIRTQSKLNEAEKVRQQLEEQQVEASKNSVSMRREYADAMVGQSREQSQLDKDYAKTTESIKNQDETIAKYKQEIADLTEQYEKQRKEAYELGTEEVESADKARIAVENFLAVAFAGRGKSPEFLEDMAGQLISLGATVEDMTSLTDYQLTELVRAYDGSIESISEILAKLQIDFTGTMDEIGEKATKAAETVGKASQDEIRAMQEAQTAEYNALKHKLDKEYDTQKAANDQKYDEDKRYYDKKYNALKNELDREYTDHKNGLDKDYDMLKQQYDRRYELIKRELDKEYDLEKNQRDQIYNERKSALDKEYTQEKRLRDNAYNELKRQLDKEYDNEKKSYDKAYDNLKDSLDKQYDAQKKTLDAEYNQIKKTLDAEYNERKKAYDNAYNERKKALDKEYKAAQAASKKYLAQYKKDQKAQVDAFKKATDTRVAEMKRELEMKKKLIESDEKRKTDDIDARIAALKGETEAEEKAQKQREQQEKLSDLRRDVNKAKSRRTRAEAEKAYNDYVTELEQEAAKERRDATIDQLEAEKDAISSNADERISALEEQYNNEIDAYKASRALELEALQEHLDSMYEAEQEAETRKLEDLKARNDVELAALKERNAAELEAVKEAQTTQLEAVKEANEAQLSMTKDANEAQLEDLKAFNEEQLAQTKLNHEDRLADLKTLHEDELTAIKDSHSQQLEDLKTAQGLELQEIKNNQSDQLQAVKDGHQAILDDKKLELEEDLRRMKEDHEAKLQAKKYENEDKLKVAKDGYEAENQALRDKNEADLEEMKAHHTHVINEMRSGKTDADTVMDEGVASVETKSESARQKFGDATGKMKEDAEKNAGKAMGSLWNTINEKAGDVGFAVKNGPVKKADDEASFLPEIFKKHSTKGVEGFVGPLRDAKDVAAATEYMRKQATKETGKTQAEMGKHSKAAAKEFGDDLKNSKEGSAGAKILKNSAVNGIEFKTEASSKAKDGAKSYGDSLSQYNMSPQLSAFRSKVIDGVNPSSGSNFYQNVATAGSNLMIGFFNGTGKVDVRSRAYNLGIEVLDEIKSALGINSPSKEMIEIGRYTVQGYEIGIQQETPNLTKQIRMLAQSTEEGFTPTFDIEKLLNNSEEFISEYKMILNDMLNMSKENMLGTGMIGRTLDANRLKDSAQKYLSECRKGVNAVLEAAETYADSADAFEAGFDVESFKNSCEKYLAVYRDTVRSVENTISEYNAESRSYGMSPLVSEFDVDSLKVEAYKFEGEYSKAMRTIENLAKDHAARTQVVDTGFNTRAFEQDASDFLDSYEKSIGDMEQMSSGHVKSAESIGSEFDLDEFRARAKRYLGEYHDVLATIENYIKAHVANIGQYDITGLSGSVSAGQDIMSNIIEGMRSMEGELEKQLSRLADSLEKGFKPTLDISSMEIGTDSMLEAVDGTMTTVIDEWRMGTRAIADVQTEAIAEMMARQHELNTDLEHIVSTGFGNERLYQSVTSFLDQTVAAANEAIEKINSRMRNSALEIAAMQAEAFGKAQYVEMANAQPATVNINISLSDVTIRETADIDKLAQALAQRTNQVLRSRIG